MPDVLRCRLQRWRASWTWWPCLSQTSIPRHWAWTKVPVRLIARTYSYLEKKSKQACFPRSLESTNELKERKKNTSNKELFDRSVFLSVSSKIFQQENVINCNKRKTELEKPRRFLHQWSVACFLFSPLHIPSSKTPKVEEEKFFQVNKLRDEQLKDLFRSIFVLL